MIIKRLVWKRVLISWVHTAVSFLVMFGLMTLVALISIRFGGFRVVLRVLMATAIISLLAFLLSEVIVNMVLGARSPDRTKHLSFISAIDDLCANTGIFFQPRPRLYILKMRGPNACAYGIGLLGQYAIGVTQDLIDMLSTEELKAVLAHELAHIRCRDVGLFSLLSVMTGGAEWLAYLFFRGKTVFGMGPFGFIIGAFLFVVAKFLFPMGRRAIGQEREFSADALGALYIGSSKPLMSALGKIEGGSGASGSQSIFGDLFISHPQMRERLAELDKLDNNQSQRR